MTRWLAPPYHGEGPHALWHVSEDAGIEHFEPRPIPFWPDLDPRIWAVDTRHLPLFWFPRDCPRGTFWAGDETADADVERFLTGDRTLRVHAVEGDWLDRIRDMQVYAYRLPEEGFEPFEEVGGSWTTREPLDPIEVFELVDPLKLHVSAGIELRLVPKLWALWDQVVDSTLEYGGIRLQNAAPPSPTA